MTETKDISSYNDHDYEEQKARLTKEELDFLSDLRGLLNKHGVSIEANDYLLSLSFYGYPRIDLTSGNSTDELDFDDLLLNTPVNSKT